MAGKSQEEFSMIHKADSRFAPSQWEMALLCNDVSLAGHKPRISPDTDIVGGQIWIHQFVLSAGTK